MLLSQLGGLNFRCPHQQHVSGRASPRSSLNTQLRGGPCPCTHKGCDRRGTPAWRGTGVTFARHQPPPPVSAHARRFSPSRALSGDGRYSWGNRPPRARPSRHGPHRSPQGPTPCPPARPKYRAQPDTAEPWVPASGRPRPPGTPGLTALAPAPLRRPSPPLPEKGSLRGTRRLNNRLVKVNVHPWPLGAQIVACPHPGLRFEGLINCATTKSAQFGFSCF